MRSSGYGKKFTNYHYKITPKREYKATPLEERTIRSKSVN